jgi:hypothetical protein
MSALFFSGCMPFSEIGRTDPGLEIHPSGPGTAGRQPVTGQDAGTLTEVPGTAGDDFLVASDSLQANDLNITSG